MKSISAIYDALAVKIAKKLEPYVPKHKRDKQSFEKICYYTNIVLRSIVNFVLVMAIAYPLGWSQHIVVFALVYGSLGLFTFGFHSESAVLSTLLVLFFCLSSAFLSIYTVLPPELRLLGFSIFFFLFYSYAPAETKNRSIPKNKREALTIKALVVLGIWAIHCFFFYEFPSTIVVGNLFFFACLCRSVAILPCFTYKKPQREEGESVIPHGER